MVQKTFEEIKPWDGSSGTGAEAREVIKQNFVKVNEGFDELSEAIIAEAQARASADATLAAAAEMALVLGLD